MTTTLTGYSSLIQALATTILVFLTAYYVRQARKSAYELEQSGKARYMPIITMRVDVGEAKNGIDVYLGNIGTGLAQNINVYAPFDRVPQTVERISPEEENVLVSFENIGMAELFEVPEEGRLLRVEYRDLFGRTIISEGTLGAKKQIDGIPDEERLTITNWHVHLKTDAPLDANKLST